MPTAAIALGSNLPSPNLGSRASNLRAAIDRIAALGKILAVSTFHDTAPDGYLDQPRFLNAALLLSTELPPLELLRALLGIERAMGRDRSNVPAKGPRIIDLDLLLIDNLILNHPANPAPDPGFNSNSDSNAASGSEALPALTLPHPALAQRRFVLAPLAEIAPDLLDPTSGLAIAQLLAHLDRTA